ncbi:RNA polymerase subunit sigma-70 [Rhizocola hellebori]|nr:RNA polymerase subunit sigma-70 [Rhizocola hellebori]
MSADALASARTGDEEAFRQLTDPYRAELQLHCYRMLGSLADAEDMLQETLLAAWRHLAGFEGRASVRAWLYRIATNRCLNALRDKKRRIPPTPVPPFSPPEPTSHAEAVWLQPYPDDLLNAIPDAGPGPETRYQSQEAVRLAFVAALQLLPPRQTATLLLRDVLGFSAAEVAQMLATTETAVKGTLQRARATLDQRRGDEVALVVPDSVQERDLTRRFAEAFTTDDIAGIVAMLTDDTWLTMPPAPHQYRGADAIAGFLRASAAWRSGRRFRLLPVRANTQPAFGCYLPQAGESIAYPAGLIVLTLGADRIHAITRFLDDDLFARFGLAPAI